MLQLQAEAVLCYKHIAPTELRSEAFVTLIWGSYFGSLIFPVKCSDALSVRPVPAGTIFFHGNYQRAEKERLEK